MKLKLEDLPKKVLLGQRDGENIYLSAPSWDCGWYWGFGYIGNKNCHYHVDGMDKTKDLHTAFKEHFGDTLTIKSDADLWTVAELFQTFYNLKETAETLGRGGAHLTNNPCQSIIMNQEEATRINKIVMPAIFLEIYRILLKNSK